MLMMRRLLRHRMIDSLDDREGRGLGAVARDAERADRQDARGGRHAHQPRAGGDGAGDRGAVRVRLLGLAQRIERAGDHAAQLGMPGVHAGIDHRDQDVVALGQAVRLLQPQLGQRVLRRIAAERRERAGSRRDRGRSRRRGGGRRKRRGLFNCLLRGGVEVVRLSGAQLDFTLQPCKHHAHRPPVDDTGAEEGRARALQADRVETGEPMALRQRDDRLRRKIAGELEHHFVRHEAVFVLRRDVDAADRGERNLRTCRPAGRRRRRADRRPQRRSRSPPRCRSQQAAPSRGADSGRASAAGGRRRAPAASRRPQDPSAACGAPSLPGLVAADLEPTLGPTFDPYFEPYLGLTILAPVTRGTVV